MSGGVIQTNHSIEYAQGIRISKDLQNSWSILTLGTTGTSGLTSDSWMVARNPSGELQIQSTDANANTGMRFTNSLVYWKGNRILDMGWNTRNNKLVFNTELDNWLRINEGSHPLGTYFNNSIVRTDNQLQVGPEGIYFNAQNGYTLLSNHLRVIKWGDGNGIDAINNTGYLQFGSVNYITFRKTDSNYNWIGDPRLRINLDAGVIECINSTITRNVSNAGYFMANFNSPSDYYKPYPIFTISSSYSPTETALNRMYGIGFTVGGSNGLVSSLSSDVEWGLYGAFNGVPKWFLSGSGKLHSTGGFNKVGSSDSEVLLGNGGTKSLYEFQGFQKHSLDLKGLDENKYYLITANKIFNEDRVIIRVATSLNYLSKPSWATHEGGFTCNLEIELTAWGWGSNPMTFEKVNYYHWAWSVQSPLIDIGQLGNSSIPLMYLRGGGVYTIFTQRSSGVPTTFTIHKDSGEFTASSQSIPKQRNYEESLVPVSGYNRAYRHGALGPIHEFPNKIHAQYGVYVNGSSVHALMGDGTTRDISNAIQLISGGDISQNWTATPTWQSNVIFIKNPVTVELNQLQHKGSMSFRKIFDGGQVTFVCSGKTIKYTGPTTFNGKDGSTAVVSIFENKCYIDIRNV